MYSEKTIIIYYKKNNIAQVKVKSIGNNFWPYPNQITEPVEHKINNKKQLKIFLLEKGLVKAFFCHNC